MDGNHDIHDDPEVCGECLSCRAVAIAIRQLVECGEIALSDAIGKLAEWATSVEPAARGADLDRDCAAAIADAVKVLGRATPDEILGRAYYAGLEEDEIAALWLRMQTMGPGSGLGSPVQ